MSIQSVGFHSSELAAAYALHTQQQSQAGTKAVQAAVSQDTGGGSAPIVSSSVQAPGSLEMFA